MLLPHPYFGDKWLLSLFGLFSEEVISEIHKVEKTDTYSFQLDVYVLSLKSYKSYKLVSPNISEVPI